ncbi:MAG: hypothetical protein M0Z81_11810 [Deltaproteobacteria bacterium]|jgi:hypothetical protein|nr:hypothetical protein [Deltaproteobacteria bacterium]
MSAFKANSLIRLSQLKKSHPDFPVSVSTLRRWRREGRYPQVFKCLGNGIFIDPDQFVSMARAGELAMDK